jgi:sulfoxide reductase heme-binding subunit YedZ
MIAAAADPLHYGWWIAARAAGIVAIVLVSVSVGLGLAMATKVQDRRPGMAVVLRRLHQYVALTALVAIAGHGVFLLLDPWLKPGVTGVTVPFAMDYRPLFTGLGVIAGWAVAVLAVSYWMRDRIGRARWKTIHRFTLVAYVLALVHVVGSGTDAGTTWLLAILALALVPLPTLVFRRLRSHTEAQAKRAATAARRVEPPPAVRRPVGHRM